MASQMPENPPPSSSSPPPPPPFSPGGPWPWSWYGRGSWGGRGVWGWFWPSALVLIGVYALLSNLGLLDWLRGDVLWPSLLILLGLLLLVSRARRR